MCGACAMATCPRPTKSPKDSVETGNSQSEGDMDTYVLDKSQIELVACASFGIGVVLCYVLHEVVIFPVGKFIATTGGEYMRW